jgi:hypothetical protein
VFASEGGVDAWDPTKYLNIWVVGYGHDLESTIAFAYLAGAAGRPNDGISIKMIRPFNKHIFNEPAFKFSLAHEVGHYLNLSHTNAPNDEKDPMEELECAGATKETCELEGDYVCDTPPMKVKASPSCDDTVNTCMETFPKDRKDQNESIMISHVASCQSMFTFGQASRMEATLVNQRSSLLGSPGGIAPPLDPNADLWVRDNPKDVGDAHTLEVVWDSDDIWVRRQPDGKMIQQHEPPLFRKGANPMPNKVYVRVRNRGCAPSANKDVKLYWAKASTALGWPAPWDGKPKVPGTNTPMGGFIQTKKTGVILGGDSTVLEFDWRPADPEKYKSFGGDKTHFCLLATVEDPPLPTTAEPLYPLVQRSNNVAWKNVDVATDAKLMASVSVGGGAGTAPQRLVFTPMEDLGAPRELFDWGQIVVDLGPGLFARWQAGGMKGQSVDRQGIVGTKVPLLPFIAEQPATFENLPLQPADLFTIDVQFIPRASPGDIIDRQGVDVYRLQVIQQSEDTTPPRTIGGQRFVLKTKVAPRSDIGLR